MPEDDRTEVVRVSGQELVPVLEHDGLILAESPAILEYLEETFPEPSLLPAEPRRAEIRVFCDWFNRVWKVAPNEYEAEEEKPAPDEARLAELGGRITASLPLFEGLLSGRDFLFAELSLADVTAFPFLKYAVVWEDGDPYRFHEILRDHLRLEGRYPALEACIRRVDAPPRAYLQRLWLARVEALLEVPAQLLAVREDIEARPTRRQLDDLHVRAARAVTAGIRRGLVERHERRAAEAHPVQVSRGRENGNGARGPRRLLGWASL